MKDSELPVQLRVHKSLKLWSLYADLEESLGTFASTKAVYARMLELRVATPQLVINFAVFLEEANYFEDAFAVSGRMVWGMGFLFWVGGEGEGVRFSFLIFVGILCTFSSFFFYYIFLCLFFSFPRRG